MKYSIIYRSCYLYEETTHIANIFYRTKSFAKTFVPLDMLYFRLFVWRSYVLRWMFFKVNLKDQLFKLPKNCFYIKHKNLGVFSQWAPVTKTNMLTWGTAYILVLFSTLPHAQFLRMHQNLL